MFRSEVRTCSHCFSVVNVRSLSTRNFLLSRSDHIIPVDTQTGRHEHPEYSILATLRIVQQRIRAKNDLCYLLEIGVHLTTISYTHDPACQRQMRQNHFRLLVSGHH